MLKLDHVMQVLSSEQFQTKDNRALIRDICHEVTSVAEHHYYNTDCDVSHLITLGNELVNKVIAEMAQQELKVPHSHTIEGLYYELSMSQDEPWKQFVYLVGVHWYPCRKALDFSGKYHYAWVGYDNSNA